jgi:hypothetical protein
MKVIALKSFQSVILSMEKDEVKKLDIEASILEDWIASGLIEEVKPKKLAKS